MSSYAQVSMFVSGGVGGGCVPRSPTCFALADERRMSRVPGGFVAGWRRGTLFPPGSGAAFIVASFPLDNRRKFK